MMDSTLSITSLKDVIDASYMARDKFGHNDWVWWRGVENTNHSLHPSIYRPPKYKPLYENEIHLNFRNRAKVRANDLPHKNDFEEWLFIMQHYGAPTRLMDWTESVFIGAYFATRNFRTRSEPAAFYALSPSKLNESSTQMLEIFNPQNEPAKSIIRAAFDHRAEKYTNNIAIYPMHVDIRMLIQHSMFTLHGSPLPLDEDPERESFLLKFEIPPDSANTIYKDLFIMGYRDSYLFPDLQHLGSELKNRSKFVEFEKE